MDNLMYDSGWSIDTTEETQGSFFGGNVSSGKLYMSHASSGDSIVIGYRCSSVGPGKGPPVGLTWSDKTYPSGGANNVLVKAGHNFGYLTFPCWGYMIGMGATSGVIGNILGMDDFNGGNRTIAFFGMLPVFASVRIWGASTSILPGIGASGGIAHYWVE